MIIRIVLDVYLNEEDDVMTADEAKEATREAILELTGDNLVVDEIFNNEGLTGPDGIRVVASEIAAHEVEKPV